MQKRADRDILKSHEAYYDSQDDDQYYYAGEPVRVLDIYTRDKRKVALVQDEIDDIFEVFYDQLD